MIAEVTHLSTIPSSEHVHRSRHIGEDVKFPPTNYSGAEYSGRGSRLAENLDFSVPTQKLLPAYPTLKKILALAFLKATYSQNPY
jgi:hypothetical protein